MEFVNNYKPLVMLLKVSTLTKPPTNVKLVTNSVLLVMEETKTNVDLVKLDICGTTNQNV